MNLKEYRLMKGLTQKELAEELNLPGVDAPLISKVEKGICSLNEMAEKALANPFEIDVNTEPITYPSNVQNLLKQPIFRTIMEMLKDSNKANPVTRDQLTRATQVTDREVRKAISDLRMAGVRIASSSSIRGYWICRSESDFKLMQDEMIARGKTLLSMAYAMQRGCEGQIELDL